VDEKAIGRRLSEIRKRRGKTQTDVAAELGVDQSLISAYERGAVRPNAPILAGLAIFLRTSSDQILGLKELEQDGLFKDRRFIRRMERIEKLPKRAKQALIKTIDTYLDGAEKR
jgi:transcriptional regulator with XRE-family HTH domain